MRAKLVIALSALVAIWWAVPSVGTAPFVATAAPANSQQPLLNAVGFRVHKQRGLMVTTWINGRGPYTFALDTGAGMNLISERLVSEAKLQVRPTETTTISGLTNATTTSNRAVFINEIGLGDKRNIFRAKSAVVVPALASGVDGILDPTDIYAPNGYTIDLPNERIETVLTSTSVRERGSNSERAVVPWVRLHGSIRPFVKLGDGRLALIDTGSGFGLAVNQRNAVVVGPRRNNREQGSRDLGGGTISARRVDPTTITIGSLVLRRIPTDILFGVSDDAPLILGRDALYPFRITFDPQRQLIEFATSERS